MNPKCKECEMCVPAIKGTGRKQYWCIHPKVKKMPRDAFGVKAPGFIGFGDTTLGSPLKIKTVPHWCPRR